MSCTQAVDKRLCLYHLKTHWSTSIWLTIIESVQHDSLGLVPETLLLAPFCFALTSSCGTQIHQHSSVSQQQDVMVFRLCDVHNREELENITLKLTLDLEFLASTVQCPKVRSQFDTV